VNTHAAQNLEQETRRKYTGGFYRPDSIMRRDARGGYFERLDKVKSQLVRKHIANRRVLDLCCATADRLFENAREIPFGCGADFSIPFLKKAHEKITPADPLAFLCANARALPFRTATFEAVYCLASLYYIPRIRQVTHEISRILEPGGIAILEMGNRSSLNTLVARAHPETAAPCHIPIGEMKRMLTLAGLEIEEHHAFQILPLWGNRPHWLRPLLGERARRLMSQPIAGRMIDEWLCRIPGLSRFAFRHLFVCRRRS